MIKLENLKNYILKLLGCKEEEYLKIVNDLKLENSILKEKLNQDIDLLIKYPSKLITYYGRTFPNSKVKCKIPVNVLITPFDPFIIRDLKNWGLYQTNEKRETLIPKIYKKIKEKYYKYKYDLNTWGTSEIWEFPFEMREKGWTTGFDCDSWAHLQVSYYRASGLEPQYVWVVAGMAKIGGHSTVYIYSDKSKKFHHLNSTYGIIKQKISDYPTHEDAENNLDNLGITDIWFSFNDVVSRSLFNRKKIKDILIK